MIMMPVLVWSICSHCTRWTIVSILIRGHEKLTFANKVTTVCYYFLVVPLQMSNLPLSYVDLDDIDLEERIGRGNVSVYRATMAGKPIAVKRMECEKNQVPHEVEVHSKLPPHPNILPLLGITHSTDGFNVYICMELAEKSLHQFLHKERNEPSPQQSTKWAIQIAQGMYHLHQNGLAHRDLKSGNILLFEDGKTVKICDFGSARPLERTNTMTGMTGTGRWMAPEFNDKANTKVNQRCDVFSYGMVLYELFAHELPFSDTHELVDIVSKIRAGERPQLQKKIPLHIKELTESCWKQYPRDRPTFESILVVGLPKNSLKHTKLVYGIDRTTSHAYHW